MENTPPSDTSSENAASLPLDLNSLSFSFAPAWVKTNSPQWKEHASDQDDEKPKRHSSKPPFRGRSRDFTQDQKNRQRDDRPTNFKGKKNQFQKRDPSTYVELPKTVTLKLEPLEQAVDALVNHIKSTSQAFNLFEVSKMILNDKERFLTHFTATEEHPTPLFIVQSKNSLYLSKEEAIHALCQNEVINQYYITEAIQLEEPKGDFKSVAVCTLSNKILGPSNHHSYQKTLLEHYRNHFSNLNIEEYKRKIKVESDPEKIQQWKTEQQRGTQWKPLNATDDSQVFSSLQDVLTDFKNKHLPSLIEETRDCKLKVNQPRQQLSKALSILHHRCLENNQKHLIEFAQVLAKYCERRGLKLFKRRAGKLFLSRIKPLLIDPSTVFTDRVNQLINYLKESQQGVDLVKIIKTLAPAETTDENQEPSENLSTEQLNVLRDLRWLVNEGYAIEYTDGKVFLAIQGNPPNAIAAQQAQLKATKNSVSTDATDSVISDDVTLNPIDQSLTDTAITESSSNSSEEKIDSP
jgi:hypothetical protein